MKIALFGGAFDPPHKGHKLVADSLIKNKIVDEVWFVPVFKHPWADRYGKRQLIEYDERVKMLDLTIKTVPTNGVTVKKTVDLINSSLNSEKLGNFDSLQDLDFEQYEKIVHFKDVSFTYDILKYFSEKYPEHEFSWVMGSEYLSRFDDFLNGHPRLIDFIFYIYPRSGHALDEKLKKTNMIFLKGMTEVTVSSTEIKQLVKNKQDFSQFVVPEVFNYIKKHDYYL